jgi:hypothetical protein
MPSLVNCGKQLLAIENKPVIVDAIELCRYGPTPLKQSGQLAKPQRIGSTLVWCVRTGGGVTALRRSDWDRVLFEARLLS